MVRSRPVKRRGTPSTTRPNRRRRTRSSIRSPVERIVALPPRPKSLIGRDEELARLRRQVFRGDTRLLTITGPPGVGKTRLALELAAHAARVLPHGAMFVDLAAVSDSALVVDAVARSVGLRITPESTLLPQLGEWLQARRLMLVIDNFEHVTEAASSIAELLTMCPDVRVVATSRTPLHVRWEQEFPLAPLAVPDPQSDPLDPVVLGTIPSVALFAERAGAAHPGFILDHTNAATVSQICRRLDGLPLAIELAAPQVKLFPVGELLARLERGLQTITDGARDRPARHRTLNSAIAWSYGLLNAAEQALFRRLAIFVGGADADAAAFVYAAEPPTAVRDALAALVDKSLLRQEVQPDGHPRFHVLESLRAFGLEQLEATGEHDDVARRHALYFADLVERAAPELHGHQQSAWLDRLELEHGNLRAALRWSTGRGDGLLGLRLAGALLWFWDTRGYWTEGRHWLGAALDAAPQAPVVARANAMSAAGHLAFHQNDRAQARGLLEWSVAMLREAGDRRGLAEALDFLATEYRAEAQYVPAGELQRECLELFRELGDDWGIAQALTNLAFVEDLQGNHPRASEMAEESLNLSRRLGRKREVAISLYVGGLTAYHQGQTARAERLFEESLAMFRGLGARMFVAYALYNLGRVARTQRAYAQSVRLFDESLPIMRDIGDGDGAAAVIAELGRVALRRKQYAQAFALVQDSLQALASPEDGDAAACLEVLAAVEALRGHSERAARWFGAAGALREAIGSPIPVSDRPEHDRYLGLARSRLHEDGFRRAWTSGAAASLQEIKREVASLMPPRRAPTSTAVPTNPLTRREQEVAGLVARGLSNREIARRLFVSPRTADTHIQHILGKLGFTSRTQVAVWAVRHGLEA